MSADRTIRILALDGIPEIRKGDDLGAFIGNALGRTSGALPLGLDDVLVVTQKIVSKAEGAVVDLTGVVPRPEAVAFAERSTAFCLVHVRRLCRRVVHTLARFGGSA